MGANSEGPVRATVITMRKDGWSMERFEKLDQAEVMARGKLETPGVRAVFVYDTQGNLYDHSLRIASD